MNAQDIGGVDNIRDHISGLVKPFGLDVEAILSVAGSRVGNSEALARSLAAIAAVAMKELISAGVVRAEPGSALWGFRAAWRSATNDHHEGEGEETAGDALAFAVETSDLSEIGRLLLARDANETRITARDYPGKLLRRPAFGSPVLDVAVGSAAVEVAKSLLEFHGAKPTRETLRMAIASGNVELIRICWSRLPAEEQKERLDLLEVAGDFHQGEVVAWLFRDADPFEGELFVGFAIRRHLADALLTVALDGFKPWWAVESAAKWAPAREVVFRPAPVGFWADGGWFIGANGQVTGVRSMRGRWTRELTESRLGKEDEVTDLVLPSGVTAITGDAFDNCAALRSLMIQAGCVSIDDGAGLSMLSRGTGAVADCPCLVKVTIPATCARIGARAFLNCSGLTQVAIPSSVTEIEIEAFCGCSGLTQLTIPPSVTIIGKWAFHRCSGLAEVNIPTSVTSIGAAAFRGCSGLMQLTIPSSVTKIGEWAFEACSGLTQLTIPANFTRIGDRDRHVFADTGKLERVMLVGSPLSEAVVANVEPAVAPDARIVSPELAGQPFGRLTIVAA